MALDDFKKRNPAPAAAAAAAAANGDIAGDAPAPPVLDDYDFFGPSSNVVAGAAAVRHFLINPKDIFEANVHLEIDRYLNDNLTPPIQFQPVKAPRAGLDWWRANRLVFPNVCRAMTKWLSVQATSAASERVFSVVKINATARCNIDAVHLSNIVFQRMNAKFMPPLDEPVFHRNLL